ncbi:hypothetical protein [Pedosphaera parvula]|uniref:Uncharacterized protein n=1 Tax=Pedosphaera parvula (strain Ellin514) TaxID=320771 RepID=B9XQT8_PEDPL|nr:hypothetical protein [Pedosphaera parvula]EEF57795.1 hypothetical protein Cflav_PD0895 [Pedosphaera parvula Ellin514]
MRKTRSAVITALVLAALGVILSILLSTGEREPVYQGKTLTYWLSDFCVPGRNPTREKLEQDKLAVRQIGTNAIPILLQWISAKDVPLKLEIVDFIWRHPWVPFRLQSAVDRQSLASSGFSILGKSQAGPAIPALVKIVRTGGGERTSGYDNVTFPMWALADVDLEAATNAGIKFGTNRWSGTNVVPISWSAPPAAANK